MEIWKVGGFAFLCVFISSCGGGGGGSGGVLPFTSAAAPAPVSPSPALPSPVTEPAPSVPDAMAFPTGSTGNSGVMGSETPARHNLFALLPAQQRVVSFEQDTLTPGATVIPRLFDPFKSFLAVPAHAAYGMQGRQMGYDAQRDRLYISMGNFVLKVPSPSKATGDVQSAAFELISSGIPNYSQMFLEPAADTVWVAGHYQSGVVLARVRNASAASGQVLFDEEGAAAQSYVSYALTSREVQSMYVDPSRLLLYVLTSLGIDVYDLAKLGPATAEPASRSPMYGNVSSWNRPIRTISVVGTHLFVDLTLDATRDRLYLADAGFGALVILDGASSSVGNVPATSTLALSDARSVAIDAAKDRLYVGGASSNAYVFDRASALGREMPASSSSVFAVATPASTANPVWAIATPR